MSRPAGLVLAGGASSRFGGDKALALLQGRSLLAWSLEALDPICREVAVSARPSGDAWRLARAFGRHTVADDPAHPSGPLAGLAAGLVRAGELDASILVTRPVDTPLVGPAVFEPLLAAATDAPAAYVTTSGGDHPLCAAWSVGLAVPLIARLQRGDHPAVRGWLREIGAVAVSFEDATPFRNVNTRADLALLEGSLAGAPDADA